MRRLLRLIADASGEIFTDVKNRHGPMCPIEQTEMILHRKKGISEIT